MIDAYTIGINIALDDGVATGVAAARRDLAQLDLAMQASGLGLQRLQAAAASVLGMGGAPVVARTPPPPKPDAAIEAVSQQYPRTSPSAPVMPAASVVSQSVAPPVPVAPRISVTLAAAPVTPIPAAVAEPTPQVLAPTINLASLGQSLAAAPVPTRPLPGFAPYQAPAPPPSAFAPAAPPAAPDPPQASPVSAAPVPAPTTRLSLTAPTPAAPPSPFRQSPPADDTRRPPAERGFPGGNAPAAAPSGPPATQSVGASQGDVFLDGMRVGRWMGTQLGRSASKPPAGAPGFDPRQSPIWAGATVGV